MKKIKLKAATAALQNKKLSEEQMNDLLGGAKCPYCKGDFEPGGDLTLSQYICSGTKDGKYYDDILVWADSKEKAEMQVFSQEFIGVYCEPGDLYNTAPGF